MEEVSSGKMTLKNDVTDLRAGSTWVVKASGLHVPSIDQLVIGHDGEEEEDSWHVQRVEVIVPARNGTPEQKITFPGDVWLSATRADCRLQATLSAAAPSASESDTCEYVIEVFTAADSPASYSGPPTIYLFGDSGRSRPLKITDTAHFGPNACAKQTFVMSALGALTKVRLEVGKSDNWRPMKVIVSSSRSDKPVVFNAGQSLNSERTSVDLVPFSGRARSISNASRINIQGESSTASGTIQLEEKTYKIYVTTSDERRYIYSTILSQLCCLCCFSAMFVCLFFWLYLSCSI